MNVMFKNSQLCVIKVINATIIVVLTQLFFWMHSEETVTASLRTLDPYFNVFT